MKISHQKTFICISAFLLSVFFLPTEIIAHSAFTINITEEGFDPQRVEIDQGTTVVFKNIGSREHWPASNIHPTHTVYPGSDIEKCGTDEASRIFDACLGIQPGEEYSFTFTEAGKWRFHDHVLPNLNGEIVVIGDDDFESSVNGDDSSQKSFLRRIYDTFTGWVIKMYYSIFPGKVEKKLASVRIFDIAYDHQKLTQLVILVGEKRVLSKLSEEAGQGFIRDCHQQAHQVGIVSYRLYGGGSFKYGDASCLSGFYHGVMGELISEWGGENFAENTTKLCGAFDNTYDKFECIHGVGHGIMAYEDYSLFTALDTCEGLLDDWWKGSCYGGIFHENVAVAAGLGVVPGHETKWVNTDDPYFPCNMLERHAGREFQCYQVQTGLMLKFTNYDFPVVSKLCSEAPERNRVACFKSLGRDIGGVALRDPKRIIELCDYAPRSDGYYKECIESALTAIIIRDFRGTESDLIKQGRELCAIVSEKEAQESCERIVAQRERESY